MSWILTQIQDTTEKYFTDSVGFEVLTAASLNTTVFWGIAPCSLLEGNRCLRGAYCLHHRRGVRGSTHLWIVGLLLRDYTALYPRMLLSFESCDAGQSPTRGSCDRGNDCFSSV